MVNIMLIYQNELSEAVKGDGYWLDSLNRRLFESPVLCRQHMF